MAVRTLIHVPRLVRRGEAVELRATIAHPMETGHRPDSEGRLVPRDIIGRFECRLDGELVFASEWYPAIAANPFIAFYLRAERAGTLSFTWTGDRGFRHQESVPLTLA
jgi:sulfur-oxidizing protein SoxZ